MLPARTLCAEPFVRALLQTVTAMRAVYFLLLLVVIASLHFASARSAGDRGQHPRSTKAGEKRGSVGQKERLLCPTTKGEFCC